MAWYWIVLIVIGYLLMWLITTIFIYRSEEESLDLSVVEAMVWPIILPVVIIRTIAKIIIDKFIYYHYYL